MRHRRLVVAVLALPFVLGALRPVLAWTEQPGPSARPGAADEMTRGLATAPRQRVTPEPAQTFGIVAEAAYVLPAADFDTTHSIDTWDFLTGFDPTTGSFVRTTSTAINWVAGLRLPAGAVVTRLEVAGCDGNGVTGRLAFVLIRTKLPPGNGFEFVTPIGDTGDTAVPGCGRFSVTPTLPPLVVDNANATYTVLVATDQDVSFDSARVFYQLRVSPAPATATFNDVPTSHASFQFVEALVASGITAGCGGGNYCPDTPLTRGQMAVFLEAGSHDHLVRRLDPDALDRVLARASSPRSFRRWRPVPARCGLVL